MPIQNSRYRGCLLGGAVGDALGAAVEFRSLGEIRAAFGPGGIRDYAPAYGRLGAITDDTQMTLFTAEGLLRAHNRGVHKGIVHVPTMVHHAYLRWLATQDATPTLPALVERGGWLLGLPELHSRRAPGNTCLVALRSGQSGTPAQPLNGSKGCGGVMRAAPAGLATPGDPAAAFARGCELAALTHGHPGGYLPAGYLAALIAAILGERSLADACSAARDLLRAQPGHQECLELVDRAMRLAHEAPAVPETLAQLGEGWVGDEALAIALYCALAAPNFAEAVILAVNHGGDSDSTGSIVGIILGALHSESAIPAPWLANLELQPAIATVADDLYRHFGSGQKVSAEDEQEDWERYPGW